MLKGAELLAKIQEMGAASKTDIAIACGYVATKKDGSQRVLFTQYYEAIIEAKGVDLGTPSANAGPRKGKPLGWNVAVSKTGVIPISAGYSALLGVEFGDRVSIERIDGGLLLRKATTEVDAEPAVA
jgi:hypothetical protein